MMVEGVKYEKIAGAIYEMRLFEPGELEPYLSKMLPVNRSIHDHIIFDSAVEKAFAEGLDARDDIKLFIKLPSRFKVDTPLGTYNPDWAIVKQPEGEPERLYLVRETKAVPKPTQLKDREYLKIRCGARHFQELGVDFKTATKASDV